MKGKCLHTYDPIPSYEIEEGNWYLHVSVCVLSISIDNFTHLPIVSLLIIFSLIYC